MVTFKGTIIKLLTILCLIILLPILININTAKAEVHTTKIYASKDKFKDNKGAYDNWYYDSKRTLYVGQFFIPNLGYTQSVLGFSIDDLPDNISSIRLFMNVTFVDNSNITVYGSETDSWTETSTAIPSKDVEITSNIITRTGWTGIDVTSFIQDQYASDKYASLVLSPTNTSSHNTFSFYASEQGGMCPHLSITYTIPSLNAQPNQDITENNIDEMNINITLEDDTFTSSTLNTSMFTLDGEAAANGLSVDSMTYIDSTHATLKLSHDGRDYDDHFQFQVAIDSSQLSSASTLQSNDISVHATDEIESGGLYDLDNIGPHPDIIISTTEKVTLTQTSHGALNDVIITCSVSGVDLEIDSVNINNTSCISNHTIGFKGSSNTLTLSGNNTLRGYNDAYHAGSPAILVDSSIELSIKGSGSLNAYGGHYSAAIGSDENQQYGTINISGGTITATGGYYGAGIGGGYKSLGGGTINISGGTLNITGGDLSAGIGGGREGAVGTINISGGTITATGGWITPGIGGGFEGSGGIVNISGGLVYASRTNIDADDIGNGRYGGGCQVSITGSSVVFLRTGNVASHPNNNIAHPYYNSETIIDNKAYGYSVPSSWSGTAYAYITDIVFVSGVSFTPDSHTLILGDADNSNDTVTLTPTISPSDATDKSVSYASSDTSVATVDAAGVVTAVRAGNTTITVTTTDGSFTDTCAITVEQRVTQITSSTKYVSLTKGITCYLIDLLPYTVLPSDATNKSVTFTTSDSSIATVDNLNGTITALNEGLAEITVTSAENPLYTYSWIINVSATASDHSSKSGKLEGKLLDSDGKPMVGYHVTLFSTPRTVITDSNGIFSFNNIPYSEHTLVINDPSFSRFIKYSINFNQTNRTNTEFDNTSKQITLNYSPNTSTFDITFQADSGLSSFDVLSLNFLDVLNTKYTKIVKNPETGYWS